MGFMADLAAVLRMQVGTIATFVNTTFVGNRVAYTSSSLQASNVPVGPVAGLALSS